ncbi:hypothetical protein CIK76_17155 [Glutamicibacter sp. BW80]|uniref:nucleotidyltransferase family protein n=1 Tax=Glutamicibacter sp. BW80 TaxID=2024404 RepID=UPI000BB85BC1|nr:nucleotidyltransferase family protein [Glutamicibacter sp. BW80]PCC27475.1 hypothetical protein CIK76_17155 [Glutamicibacter sp. BW80]
MSHNRYVIMANGKGTRWGGHLGIPKQLIEIEGETLLRRIVRQLSFFDPCAEVIISSSDSRHETVGATRHKPRRNEIELDRFVHELIDNDTCFLYGDTFYTDEAISLITEANNDPLTFFGDNRSIVGVSCRNIETFTKCLAEVRDGYEQGRLLSCIGWQVYESYTGQLYSKRIVDKSFVWLDQLTAGFNSPEDLRRFIDSLDGEVAYSL